MELKEKNIVRSYSYSPIMYHTNIFITQKICLVYFKYVLESNHKRQSVFHTEVPSYSDNWIPLNKDYESRRKI